MALALLSTRAQNEVEYLSANVKLGLKMKMKRVELMRFNGCQGYGANTIANDLTRRGIKNKKGIVKWTDSGIRGIVTNEQYKGDLLLGKTFTVDSFTKCRIENMVEEDQFYLKPS